MSLARWLTVTASLSLSATALSAQAVPSLGAEALIGTGGITAISPWGTPGVAANPAQAGCCARWTLGLAVLTAPSTDVNERAFAGTLRAGRLGFGLRLATRQVTDLFDDPVLEEADLRVEDTDAALSASLLLGGDLRFGVSGMYSSSTVLGASGDGFGARLGMHYTRPTWDMGVYYGTILTATTWRIGGGSPAHATGGVRRLAIAGSLNTTAFLDLLPRISLEVDSESGDRSDRWVRGNLGWSLFDDQFQLLGGAATEVGPGSIPAAYESSVGLRIAGFLVYLGGRLGAEPAPGNTYVLGAVFSHR